MPRSFTFATIAEYQAAKGNSGAIYAELVSSGIKSGSCVSKITATGDVFIDSINPFVTPELGQEGDTLYYSSAEGYRFLRAGNTTWDDQSYGQVYIDLAKIPSGFSVVAPYTDIFNYKQTDENIGSGKASMTKILGNTVAWNQIIKVTSVNGKNGIIYTLNSDGSISASGTSEGRANGQIALYKNSLAPSHKYYVRSIKISGSNDFRMSFIQQTGTTYVAHDLAGNNAKIITTRSDIDTLRLEAEVASVAGITANDRAIFIATDLTLLYGSSIDGLTDAQILAKFESEFPGYHSYNEGTLISNKAKAIEFVGFNKWDGNYTLGEIDQQTGQDTLGSYIRCVGYIPVLESTEYCVWADNKGLVVYYYDANRNYLYRDISSESTKRITTPSGCRYLRFRTFASYGSVYNHDICINLSGKRNGQYEPYKKVVLPLPNLDQIKVYSHNIWDEEWELGRYDSSTGEKAASDAQIRCKNFIPVLPSTIYYIRASSGAGRINFYDGNKGFISNIELNNPTGSFTTPSNALYAVFWMSMAYGSTYNHDICINLSSSFNGQYEPHGILTKSGLYGLSAKDELVGNKLIKRRAQIDLSTCAAAYDGWADYKCVAFTVPGIKYNQGATANTRIIHSKYQITNRVGISVIGGDSSLTLAIGYRGQDDTTNGKSIVVKDANSTSKQQLIDNLAGTILDYELATPIEYEIYSPTKMPFNWKYRVSEYHTKKMLPENGEEPTSAPFACEIKQI